VRTLLALCFLLIGCHGRSDAPRVRIAVLGTGLQTQQMPIILADTLGFYRHEGLDVTLVNLSSNSKTVESLIGGSADAAGIAYMQTIQLAARGQHIRAFFIGVRRTNNVLAVAPASAAKIHRVEELRGSVIGVPAPNSPTHLWVNYILAEHGVHPSEVSAVGIGIGTTAFAAAESGRIQALAVSGGDHIRLLRRDPSTRILVDGASPEAMREVFGGDRYASGALAAKQEWLDRNPGAARKLAKAAKDALQWISTHSPEEIRKQLPEALRSRDSEIDLTIIRHDLSSFTTDGAMPEGAPEAIKHFLDATVDDMRNAKVDLSATWTNQFLAGASQ